MGVGSWLSRYLGGPLLRWFIRLEILVGLVGGASAPLLFGLSAHVGSFRVLRYGLVGLLGTLVGLKIPPILRILQGRLAFKELMAKDFLFDYVGFAAGVGDISAGVGATAGAGAHGPAIRGAERGSGGREPTIV